MRILVVVALMLAAGYFVQQNFHYRSALSEALIAAHRSDAVTACAKRGQELARRVPAQLWVTPDTVRLKIGDPDLHVYYWQTNHAMWDAAYKHPHLVLMATGDPNFVLCEYDVVNASASVRRL